MTFLNPMALVGVAAVAVVAALALVRPARKVVVVSSLRLWRRAVEAAEPGKRQRTVPPPSWWLLLAGAMAAAMAIGRPVWRSQPPRRHVAVVLAPCAEVANPPGRQSLRLTAERLLRRLDRVDRVSLVQPARLGGASDPVPRDEALRRVAAVKVLPVAAEMLSLPAADQTAQHVYRIVPATLARPAGPRTTDIALPTSTPPVTLDALAAEALPGRGGQLLVALLNHRPTATVASLAVAFDGAANPSRPVQLAAGERKAVVLDIPAGVKRVAVSIGQLVGQQAELIHVEHPRTTVATIGRANPFVQRFLGTMPGVTETADVAEAEVVIAVGAHLPAGRPGIVFAPPAPPAPPTGWQPAPQAVGPLALVAANVLADDPLLHDVHLAQIAVRRAHPMLPAAGAEGRRLVTIPAGTLILATESPNRLTIAIDPAARNTNWGLHESFPILLANALTWMSPNEPGSAWQLTWESAGVIGLGSADAPDPDPMAVPLPEPVCPAASTEELWPLLAALAGAGWLTGWWRRSIERRR